MDHDRAKTARQVKAITVMPKEKRMTETIHIYLLNEGTDVWKPVAAERVSSTTFRIPSSAQIPEEEEWMFIPGDVVCCEIRKLSGGECLVATRNANQ